MSEKSQFLNNHEKIKVLESFIDRSQISHAVMDWVEDVAAYEHFKPFNVDEIYKLLNRENEELGVFSNLSILDSETNSSGIRSWNAFYNNCESELHAIQGRPPSLVGNLVWQEIEKTAERLEKVNEGLKESFPEFNGSQIPKHLKSLPRGLIESGDFDQLKPHELTPELISGWLRKKVREAFLQWLEIQQKRIKQILRFLFRLLNRLIRLSIDLRNKHRVTICKDLRLPIQNVDEDAYKLMNQKNRFFNFCQFNQWNVLQEYLTNITSHQRLKMSFASSM